MGLAINNYRLLFLLNIFMRMACWPLVRRIREASSSASSEVLQELIHTVSAEWPLRFLMFPVNLYRRLGPGGDRDAEEDDRAK